MTKKIILETSLTFLFIILIRGLLKVSFIISYNIYSYMSFATEGFLVWISVFQHLIQIIPTFGIILMIAWFTKSPLHDFGLTSKTWNTHKIFGILITIAIIALEIGFYEISAWPVPNEISMSGSLVFMQIFDTAIAASFSEELLYRALPIPVMLGLFRQLYPASYSLHKKSIFIGIVFASAMICVFAQLQLAQETVQFVNFSLLQSLVLFIQSCMYAVLFVRNQNIISPFIAHSISNVIVYSLAQYLS